MSRGLGCEVSKFQGYSIFSFGKITKLVQGVALSLNISSIQISNPPFEKIIFASRFYPDLFVFSNQRKYVKKLF